jgi:hypothetical protein
MRTRSCLMPLAAIVTIALATQASAEAVVRQQNVISSAGARATWWTHARPGPSAII